jgi:hypothetical protein
MKTTKPFRGRSRDLRVLFLATSLLRALAMEGQAQFLYQSNNDGTITITQYTGPGGDVTIPSMIDGLPVISIGGFANSAVTSVTIPNGVTTIGRWAFNGCTGLRSVTIPSSVGDIAENMLKYNMFIDYAGSFAGCPSLRNISVDPLNQDYTSLDGVLFDKTMAELMVFPRGKAGGYAVPSGVTIIDIGAFANCIELISVTFPDSVMSMGSGVFAGCSGLEGVFFRGNAPQVFGIIADTNTTVYYLPGRTGWGGSFGGCPAVLWNPEIQIANAGAGQTSPLRLTILGTPGIPFVLEAAPDLAAGPWWPLQLRLLKNGQVSFSDAEWTNYPARFYRIRWPF